MNKLFCKSRSVFEFLGYFTKSEDGALSITDELITAVVDEAHTL